jgi:hypothetical protein
MNPETNQEAFGPGLVGKYVHHNDVKFEKRDDRFCPALFTQPIYPDDNDVPDTVDGRALKAARDEGAQFALAWVRSWLGAAGFGGLKGQAVALADALRAIPGAAFAQLCEKSGCSKQTGHIARERLMAVLPLLAIPDQRDEVQVLNQQKAMRESWRKRRKEKNPEATPGFTNEKKENPKGLQASEESQLEGGK